MEFIVAIHLPKITPLVEIRFGYLKMKPKKNRRTKWTSEEREKLKNLFEEFEGDIVKISKELRRGERTVRMNLFFMGLISESEVDKKLIVDF